MGKDLSAGLDALLQGPTVIDCGMFCQLSLWFGIRYLIGNAVFNRLFGQAPFYVTQLLYEPIKDPSKPALGNPLYSFFEPVSDQADVQKAPLGIEYITNHKFYAYKHPGGHYIGENCL